MQFAVMLLLGAVILATFSMACYFQYRNCKQTPLTPSPDLEVVHPSTLLLPSGPNPRAWNQTILPMPPHPPTLLRVESTPPALTLPIPSRTNPAFFDEQKERVMVRPPQFGEGTIS